MRLDIQVGGKYSSMWNLQVWGGIMHGKGDFIRIPSECSHNLHK